MVWIADRREALEFRFNFVSSRYPIMGRIRRLRDFSDGSVLNFVVIANLLQADWAFTLTVKSEELKHLVNTPNHLLRCGQCSSGVSKPRSIDVTFPHMIGTSGVSSLEAKNLSSLSMTS